MTPRMVEAVCAQPGAMEAFSGGICIRTGRSPGSTLLQRKSDDHQIDAPGSHASALLAYTSRCGERREVRVSDRHISFIPAGQAVDVQWASEAPLTTILVRPAFLHAMAQANDLSRYEMTAQYASVDPFLWHMARSIEQQLRNGRALEKSYVESVAIVIGQHLLYNYTETPFAAPPLGGLPRYKVRRAIDYIRAHYQEEIGFKDIAGQLDMSPFHFARMFRQSTNESPHQFIMRCRIDAAKKLLIESDRSIADIAFDVGYKSQSYFTTRFALLAGMTPAAFRAAR
jgi:AraC family transcriptional regulator